MSSAIRIGLLVAVVAIVQVSILAPISILGGTPDALLVTLVCIALLRGSVAGAVAGFTGGLLLDIATLGTLGISALLLTVAGYWAGRYGETTGRGRSYALPLTVTVMTILVALGGLGLHYMLGETVSAQRVLVTTLLPAIPLNLLLAWPINKLCRALLPPPGSAQRSAEVQLLV
jgi:rod shape-determining protein MreD